MPTSTLVDELRETKLDEVKTQLNQIPIRPEPATDTQRFRIIYIAGNKIRYQLADGIEWGKPRDYEINIHVIQTASSYEKLGGAVKRVFDADHWSDASVEITSLKMTYAEAREDDEDAAPKRKKKAKPGDDRQPGELIKVAIASTYQSEYTTKDLALGTFEQQVDRENPGDLGFLNTVEREALEKILDEVGFELARQLNKRIEYKPIQMRLF
jgi:hypothetical protein